MATTSRCDLILIHPPSVYDFREKTIFYGPISDVIPSSTVFEMYPVGFLTMAAYLRKHGYRVRIVNLALLMMRRRDFDAEAHLRSLDARLFGIDLHWLPHAHGSIEVARLLKRLHPSTPIVMGGISATYFHEELIEEPAVDFVLRGSVTEPALLELMRHLDGVTDLAAVAGLDYVDGGRPRSNPPASPPLALDVYGLDLGMLVRDVLLRLDFWSCVPFHAWWRHPITAVFTVRGCDRGCVTCGASHAAFGRFMNQVHPVRRSPAAIVAQAAQLGTISRAPIFLVGDLLDGGADYARAAIEGLGALQLDNRITFEFFAPPPPPIIELIDRSLRNWSAELSPESHDPEVRAKLGKARYSNAAMEAAITAVMASRCAQLDLFFMVGLPLQTYDSVLATVDYVGALFAAHDRRLSAFVTPMGPFIDPGSDGFERAEALGYRLYAKTLAEHRALLENRDWAHILNYETHWMTRRQIVEATYDGAERLNDLKQRHGRVDDATADGVRRRLAAARSIKARLDAAGEGPLDAKLHANLLGEIRAYSEATINDKAELFPPKAFLKNFRVVGSLKTALRWRG